MSEHARRGFALAAGLVCHGLFIAAIAWIVPSLYLGMEPGRGDLHGSSAWIANGLLLMQFPLLHSALLTDRGRKLLARLAPAELGRTLVPTTFSAFAGLQLLATFALWSPSGIEWFRPSGALAVAWNVLFAASWLFLGLALRDGGLGLQTGWIGWSAAWSGRAPRYGPMPITGTFRLCRQPIYLGFAATLWAGPVWTPDHLLLALTWTAYCVLGPLHKERRFLARHGEAFAAYRARVPYFLPKLPR